MITTIPDRERALQAQVDALKEELARLQAQKPVAWVDVKDRHEGPYEFHGMALLDSGKHHLYAAPPAQPDHQGHSCTHKCTWPQCEAAKQEQRPQRLPLVQATAPREIWLEISDEQDDNGEPFPDDTEGITWCQDSALTCEVKYVRADLAAQPAHPDEFACPLCFDDPANIKPAEPVQLTETEIFKAYTTATGKVLPNMGSSRAELVAITRIVERAHGITGEKNDR